MVLHNTHFYYILEEIHLLNINSLVLNESMLTKEGGKLEKLLEILVDDCSFVVL